MLVSLSLCVVLLSMEHGERQIRMVMHSPSMETKIVTYACGLRMPLSNEAPSR